MQKTLAIVALTLTLSANAISAQSNASAGGGTLGALSTDQKAALIAVLSGLPGH